MRCVGQSFWQNHNEMVKTLFTHIYSPFTTFVDFYIILSIKPNALIVLWVWVFVDVATLKSKMKEFRCFFLFVACTTTF